MWLSGEYSLLLVGWMTGCITLRSLNKKDDWGREVDGIFWREVEEIEKREVASVLVSHLCIL